MKLLEKLDMRWNKTGTYKSRWGLFLCKYCNRRVEKNLADGRRGKSCGCAQRELSSQTKTIHGQTPKNLYQRWLTIKSRCYNPNDPGYKVYGSRGVQVCAEWRSGYQPFRKWALKNGYREGLALCRKNVKKNYMPENCHFIKDVHNAPKRTTTKMSWDKVRIVRQLYKDGSMSQDQLGKKFNVTPSSISLIVNNITWVKK